MHTDFKSLSVNPTKSVFVKMKYQPKASAYRLPDMMGSRLRICAWNRDDPKCMEIQLPENAPVDQIQSTLDEIFDLCREVTVLESSDEKIQPN